MKRTIILLLLLTFVFPFGIQVAEAAGDGMAEILCTPETPTILSKPILTVVSNVDTSLDLRNSNIAWFVNGELKNQGKGLYTYALEIGKSINPIEVKVRIGYESGTNKSYYDVDKTITPGYSSSSSNATRKLMARSTNPGPHDIEIRTSPTSPREFQRVTFTVVDKLKRPLAKMPIKWTLNGKQQGVEMEGVDVFTIRLLTPAHATKVGVEVAGYGSDEVILVPRNDPSLSFSDSQATRVAECIGQSFYMLDRNSRTLEREAKTFLTRSTKAYKDIGEDVAFIEDTIIHITKEAVQTGKDFIEIATTFGASRPADPLLIKIGKQAIEFGQYILDNDIAARLKYVYNRIEEYKRLINWYNAMQYRIQAQADSMLKQMNSQKERCLEIANEKPDYSVDTGTINEYRKYEW